MIPLRPRQREILLFLASGFTYKKISRILRISPITVRNHVSGILKYVQAQNSTQAVVRAITQHLITLEEIPMPTNSFNQASGQITWKQEGDHYWATIGLANLTVIWNGQDYDCRINGITLKNHFSDLLVAQTHCVVTAYEWFHQTILWLKMALEMTAQMKTEETAPDRLDESQ